MSDVDLNRHTDGFDNVKPEELPPLACLIHEKLVAKHHLETEREIAEFGKVKFGLCDGCLRKKKTNPHYNTRIMDKLNKLLLAERRRKSAESSADPRDPVS